MGRCSGRKIGITTALLAGLAWMACGRSGVTSTSYTNPAIGPTDFVFTISPSTLSPAVASVPPGARVTFLNRDSVGHQIASDLTNGQPQCPELNGPPIPANASFTFVMANREEICGFHDLLPGPTPNDTPGNNQQRPVVTGTILVTAGSTDGGAGDGGPGSTGGSGSSGGSTGATTAGGI